MSDKKIELTKDVRNIYQRMLAVMTDVKYVQKENKKVNNMYTFVSHDAVVSKIRCALITHGICITSNVIEHKIESRITKEFDYKNKEKEVEISRTIVKLELKFINVDSPEDFIVINSYGYGIDRQDKGIGKAISYAYKYGLLKSFCLATGDDPEKDSVNMPPVKKEKPKELSKEVSKEKLLEQIKELKMSEKEAREFLDKAHCDTFEEMPAKYLERVIINIKEVRNGNN